MEPWLIGLGVWLLLVLIGVMFFNVARTGR